MFIYNIEEYLDGGSLEIATDKGVYFIDSRLKTKTKGKLYKEYPKMDDSNIVKKDVELLAKEFLKALKNYPEKNTEEIINKINNLK